MSVASALDGIVWVIWIAHMMPKTEGASWNCQNGMSQSRSQATLPWILHAVFSWLGVSPPPPPPSAAIVNLLLKLLTLHMSVCAAAVLLCVTADPNAYAFQPENALKLKPWDHSTRDTTLLDLIPFLQMVQEVHVEVRHESSKLC